MLVCHLTSTNVRRNHSKNSDAQGAGLARDPLRSISGQTDRSVVYIKERMCQS